ncbi:MAG: EMC3/TMCO1 family protein [Candidatus Thorarchaeota archaeon]
MDIWSDFIAIFAPVSVMPWSTVFVALVALGIVLVSIWMTRRFSDMEKMKEDMAAVKEWQARFNEARKSMDPILLQQVQEDQGRIMRLQSSMMTARCKPMCYFYIPLILFWGLMNAIYGNSIVAVIPFNIQDVLPFLTGMIGTPTAGGFGLSFYGFYFLVGLGLGSLIRRQFGMDMMT